MPFGAEVAVTGNTSHRAARGVAFPEGCTRTRRYRGAARPGRLHYLYWLGCHSVRPLLTGFCRMRRMGVDSGERKSRPVVFLGLGARVKGDGVFTISFGEGRRLGDLAGAHAELTDGTRPHRVGAAVALGAVSFGAGLLVGLTRKHKASAFVVFADGSVHEKKLDGKSAIGGAQRDAVRFNALAAAAQSAG